MPALLELQQKLAGALLNGAQAQSLRLLADELELDPLLLAIHRNTALSTLSHALALNFPAVRALVGADFFTAAAHEFIAAQAPMQACLNDYGSEFAAFLAAFPPAATLSYLADVARLEWAVCTALHAQDALPLELSTLSGIDAARRAELRFEPHPALAVLRLSTPADAIWRAVLAEDDAALAALDVSAGPVWLLIERSAEGVQVRRLIAGGGIFLQQLSAGSTIQAALEAAEAATSAAGFAFDAALADHLAAGRFIGWRLPEATPTEDKPTL